MRGCLLLVALAAGPVWTVGAAPYTPASDDTVIETLRADARADALRRLSRERRASAAASDPTVAVSLARRYIERSRATADPRMLGYAQGILAPWWTSNAAPADVMLLRATILQARHRFDASLADLDRVLQARPEDAQAWLTRATVLRVQGRFPQAAKACERMKDVSPGVAATLCELSIKGVSGDLDTALDAMASLQDRAMQEPPSIQAWFDAEFADMLERAGRRDEAEARYRAALGREPTDLGLIGAFADFLLDGNRATEAEAITAPWRGVDALCLRNAIARARLGRPQSREADALPSAFEAAHRRGEDLHLREASRYRLEVSRRPAEALRLAQENWKVQHEPWDARLLIESAAAAGVASEAQAARRWLADTKLQDARIPVARPAEGP